MALDKPVSTATKSKAYSFTYSSSAYAKKGSSLDNSMVNISRNPSDMQDTAHAHDNQGHSTLPEKCSGFAYPIGNAGHPHLRRDHISTSSNDEPEGEDTNASSGQQRGNKKESNPRDFICESDFRRILKPR